MITLINTSKNYSVSGEALNFRLSGNASAIVETSLINNFNGSFTTTDGVYCGNFNYHEDEHGKAGKTIYDVDKANFVELDTLLDNVIAELKQVINDN